MSRLYYTLVSREDASAPWAIEFGDYSRANVKSEYDIYRDHGIAAKHLKIISSGDKQTEIECAVALLNAPKSA